MSETPWANPYNVPHDPAEAALWYAGHGLRVFPLNGKRPITERGHLDATDDQAEVRRLFAGRATNIGLPCRANGILLIDVDPRNDGDETLDARIRAAGQLPLGPIVETGGELPGRHLYFTDTGAGPYRGSLGAGVDVKSEGYVVLPPSVHPLTGRAYRWIAWDGLVPLSAAWLGLVRRPPPTSAAFPTSLPLSERASRAASYVRAMDPSISGSGGHRSLWRAALACVKGFGLDADVALAVLQVEFNGRCEPPWSERELRHKVEGAARASVTDGYLLGGKPA